MRKHLCVRKNMLYLVMCLLASGCLTLSSHIYREYHLMTQRKTWDEAQIYCREMHTDLATIGSRDDLKRLVNMAAKSNVTVNIWIGLKKTGVAASWLWSVGETPSSHGVAEYTNWANLPDSSHNCGGMRGDGKWLSALCTTTLPFVCQGDMRSSGLSYVVFQAKTWRQALKHCRQNNSDLASVMSLAENLALQRVINENAPLVNSVWIGLFRDKWKWSDQSIGSFRYWEPSQPNNDGICTLFHPPSTKWYDRGCGSSHPFVCYNEKTKVRKQIVRVQMQSNSFINFNDFAVSEAILNQIQNNYEGAKLYWRVQQDGKVFHKKEKKKTIKACENVK